MGRCSLLVVLHWLVNMVKVLSPSFWWSWRVPWGPKSFVPSLPLVFKKKSKLKRNFYNLAIMQKNCSLKKCTYGFPVTIINFPSRVLYTTLFCSSSSHSTTSWHTTFLEKHCAEYSYRSAEQHKLTVMLSALTLGIVKGWKISANAFCKKFWEKHPIKMCFYTQLLFLFCTSACKLQFLQGEVVWTAERWGQVECGRSVDGTGKKHLLIHTSVTMFTGTSILWCSFAAWVIVSKETNRERAVLYAEKGTGNWPWLYHGFLYKTGLLHFLQLCPNLCLETRAVGAHWAVWSLRGLVAAELAVIWRRMDVEYWCRSCSFQKWKPDCCNNTGK